MEVKEIRIQVPLGSPKSRSLGILERTVLKNDSDNPSECEVLRIKLREKQWKDHILKKQYSYLFTASSQPPPP